MNKIKPIMLIVVLFSTISTFGQKSTPDASTFSLHLTPGLSFPIGRDVEPFSMGGGASLTCRLKTPMLPILFLEGGAGFSIAPLNVAPGEPVDKANLSLISPRVGAGIIYEIIPKLSVSAHIHGGYYFASLDIETENSSGSNPLLNTGAAISYRLLPSLSLGLGASYRNFFGLYNDIMFTLGTSYNFQGRGAVMGGILPSKLKPYKDLKISQPELEPVFPVFFKYYDENPIGLLTIENKGKIPLEDVKISLFVNQYMDNPNVCKEIEFLKGGEKTKIDLYALFNNRVLEISEGTKVQINITVESSVAGENYGNETVQTLRMYDRNAITWEDDRRAAAFVTMKDPTVLKFSKNITSMVKGKASRAINGNLLTAIALHEALSLYGISYVIDPSTPYKELSEKKLAVDYLQFPNQTLEYKAGDCDDLSILYSALLESVGIKTAFITIPGHIYMAFSLNMSPAEAKKQFIKPDNLILLPDNTWIPVEITEIGGGFLKAWETGAKQWRENSSKDQAGFFPIHEAWEIFEPVGFSGEISAINIPSEDKVVSAYLQEVMKYIDSELYPRVSKLEEQIKTSGGNVQFINKLGILYARYGMNSKAETQFKSILNRQEYVPALINMGNITFLAGDMDKALAYYERAFAKQPANTKVLLSLAKVNHELAKYNDVEKHYTRLVKLDKDLAARYSYLDLKSGSTNARALEAEKMKEAMVWEE